MASNGHNLSQSNGNLQEARPYIEFRDVCKAFGSHAVLDHVNFDVPSGQTMCILGRSGVGKSVSLQLIMGFLKADRGEVIVAGENINNMDEPNLERIRKKVTMVFQNGALFDSLSVGENVAFPLRERRDLNEEQIPGRGRLARDGRSQGNARSSPLRSLDWHEAFGRHCACIGGPARMHSVRRADHDGRSANGPTARRPYQEA